MVSHWVLCYVSQAVVESNQSASLVGRLHGTQWSHGECRKAPITGLHGWPHSHYSCCLMWQVCHQNMTTRCFRFLFWVHYSPDPSCKVSAPVATFFSRIESRIKKSLILKFSIWKICNVWKFENSKRNGNLNAPLAPNLSFLHPGSLPFFIAVNRMFVRLQA